MTKEEMEEIYEFALKSGLAPDLVYKDGDKYSDRFENFKAFAFFVSEKATAELRADIKINQRNLLQKLTRGQE